MERLLIVDDEEELLRGLAVNFRREGYEVLTAASGEAALDLVAQEAPDLIVLDVMMPGMSGLDVCRELRRRGVETPVIMLTARGEEIDKVVGLEVGADDYVTKPFGLRELMARVRARLRRRTTTAAGAAPARFRFGDVAIDFERLRADRSGRPLELSAKEFDLLRLLVSRRGEVLTRDEILRQVWGYEDPPLTRTVDTHILKLRQKLESDPANPAHIHTVYGEGYRFTG
ncbi:MAG TPA: response regulator transcription factor [Candidatus Polarisedimenticolia bacterium]|nr:response regulator transcription factor [Candidatus Polarisedimenticolia bacterium]